MTGLPGIILQGTATLAIALREIIEKEADGNSGRISSLFCRFTGMVLPGGGKTFLVYRELLKKIEKKIKKTIQY
jgi:acyl dehydratase